MKGNPTRGKGNEPVLMPLTPTTWVATGKRVRPCPSLSDYDNGFRNRQEEEND